MNDSKPRNSQVTAVETESLGLKGLAHPPYSPDSAPSGFFFFRGIKRQANSQSYTSLYDLEMATRSIRDRVPVKTLRRSIEDWIAGCGALSASHGNYLARE
jgi:hypothetical protein